MRFVVTVTKRLLTVTTRTHETIASVRVPRMKAGMKRTYPCRKRVVEEIKLVAIAAPVQRSFFIFVKRVIPHVFIENNFK